MGVDIIMFGDLDVKCQWQFLRKYSLLTEIRCHYMFVKKNSPFIALVSGQ